jgi:hypothetical protein
MQTCRNNIVILIIEKGADLNAQKWKKLHQPSL